MPWTTAAGDSRAVVTGRSPCARTAMRSPMPPTTSTAEPGGTRSATSRAAACAEVTTSSAHAGIPSSVRCAAIAAGVREALFVTKASRSPRRRASASASGAPGTAWPPR